jgi:hypothetical protein
MKLMSGLNPTDTIVSTFTPNAEMNIVITIIASALLLYMMYMFLKWNRERNNPYFMNEMTFSHKRFVKVEYFKLWGSSFLEDGEEKCPEGEKGVYFKRLGRLLPVPSIFFINGKNRKLKFVMVDTGSGFPIMLTQELSPKLPCSFEDIKSGDFNKAELQTFFDNYARWCKVAKANDDSYELLLSQHIDALYNDVQKKADDDKTWNERMMEAAPQFAMLGIIFIAFVTSMYFVNDILNNGLAQVASTYRELAKFYTAHSEQQMYCSTMISKYGSEIEKNQWNEIIHKNQPPNVGDI